MDLGTNFEGVRHLTVSSVTGELIERIGSSLSDISGIQHLDYITCDDNNTTAADATGNPIPNDISETGRNDSTPNSFSIATNDVNDLPVTTTVRANPNTHKRKLLWYPCRWGRRKVRLQNFEYNGFSGPNPAEISQTLQTPFEF